MNQLKMQRTRQVRCYGRKLYQNLSTRQQRRIRVNLQLASRNENQSQHQDTENDPIKLPENNIVLNTQEYVSELEAMDTISDSMIPFDNSSTNISDTSCDDDKSYKNENYEDRQSFMDSLARCFVTNNISLKQGDQLLKVLRMHDCLSYLSKSCKTLIHTPRTPVNVIPLAPGEYVHFHLEQALLDVVSHTSISKIPESLLVDFSTDGVCLHKSSNTTLWPIHVRIINIPYCKPSLVGVYQGPRKPNDAMDFLKLFVEDFQNFSARGGLKFNKRIIPVRFRCFIADAPARAFILNHVGHNAATPCSKCTVKGTSFQGRMIFLGTKHTLRTDEKYRRLAYRNHIRGESPLSYLLNDLVNQLPFESLHLLYLGVAKKMLSALVTGKYNKRNKLKSPQLNLLSRRLELIKRYCPSEFSRRQRIITEFARYKGTELRQFMLYTGSVILAGIAEESVYLHFLILNTAIRILNQTEPSQRLLLFAENALEKFVERSPRVYGYSFMSYNVHGLLHIADDVRHYGPLDSLSAFPYENEMSTYRRLCRKPDLALQQISNRMEELRKTTVVSNSILGGLTAFGKHSNGPCSATSSIEFEQFRSIRIDDTLLSSSTRDSCCILNDLSVCIIVNVLKKNESVMFAIRKFRTVTSFFDIGIPSSEIGIFRCCSLSDDVSFVSLREMKCKCFRMPLWLMNPETNNRSDDSSYERTVVDQPLSEEFVVCTMQHYY